MKKREVLYSKILSKSFVFYILLRNTKSQDTVLEYSFSISVV